MLNTNCKVKVESSAGRYVEGSASWKPVSLERSRKKLKGSSCTLEPVIWATASLSGRGRMTKK